MGGDLKNLLNEGKVIAVMEVCPSESAGESVGCRRRMTEASAEEIGLRLRLDGWVSWAGSGKRLSWWRKWQEQVHGGCRRHGGKKCRIPAGEEGRQALRRAVQARDGLGRLRGAEQGHSVTRSSASPQIRPIIFYLSDKEGFLMLWR